MAGNPYRNEFRTTKLAKGRAMGVSVDWMPARAEKLTGLSMPKSGEGLPPRQNLPQFPEDSHGPGYDSDAKGWVRGEGEDATKKPGFSK